jgi:hypothetical protein
MPNGPNLSTLNSDNSPKSTVNSTIQAPIQAPRRKFVGEGRLRKVGSNVLSPYAFSIVLDIDLIKWLNLKYTMTILDIFFFLQ